MRMPQRVGSPFARTAVVLSALLLGPATGRADTLARLLHWEGPGVLTKTHAPGVVYYRLIARAQRDRNASVEGRYNLQVVLPGGQVETHSIPDQEVRAGRLTVLVPASAVRNLRPEQVYVRAG